MVFIDQGGEENGWFLNEDVIELIGSQIQEAVIEVVQKTDEILNYRQW